MNQAPRSWWDWPVLVAILVLVAVMETRCDTAVSHFAQEAAP